MKLYLKDYVTAGNMLAGLAAALFAMRGDLMMAALMMPVAMAFDASDGLVARLTGRHNRFGGELDNVCDHMSYGVAPAFLLYAAYEPVFRDELSLPGTQAALLAFLVAGIPLFFASIRFARFNTYHYQTPGVWLGVPRPATGFALAALVNSHLFAASLTWRLVSIGVVLVLGFLNASTFAYPNHHGLKGHNRIIWFYFAVFASLTLGSIALGPVLGLVSAYYVGDLILLFMATYVLLGWLEIPGSVRRHAAAVVAAAEAGMDPPTAAPPEAARQGTLRGTTPAWMAYLLGPISGVWVLRQRDPKDALLGFHAWQATFSLVAVVYPFLFLWIASGMVREWLNVDLVAILAVPMAVFMAGYWVAVMVGAARGKKWRAPFIGWQAEKQLL